MPKSDFDSWLTEAEKLEAENNPLNVPYHVALREAAAVADFVERYWEPAGDRPGLRRVKKRVPEATAGEIRSLIRAVQEAQTRLLMQVDPVVAGAGERARFLIDELESAIEYTLDDGVKEEADQKLAQLKEFHSQDGERSSELAQALRDYAALADELKARIQEEDEDFDPAHIAEARKLADLLAAQGPAAQATAEAQQKGRELARTRNRMLHLLTDQLRTVRRAAARVFEHHPAILREVTSAYERRRRAEARRARKKEEPKPLSPACPARRWTALAPRDTVRPPWAPLRASPARSSLPPRCLLVRADRAPASHRRLCRCPRRRRLRSRRPTARRRSRRA